MILLSVFRGARSGTAGHETGVEFRAGVGGGPFGGFWERREGTGMSVGAGGDSRGCAEGFIWCTVEGSEGSVRV